MYVNKLEFKEKVEIKKYKVVEPVLKDAGPGPVAGDGQGPPNKSRWHQS